MKINDIFEGAKNVQYTGVTHCEDVGEYLPTFELKEPTVEEWNAKAEIANTKAFVAKFNKEPKDYDEVLTWVYSMVEECKKKAIKAGTYMAFA